MSRITCVWVIGAAALLALAAAGVALFDPSSAYAIVDESNCLACHGTRDLSRTEESGRVIGLFVNREVLESSVHKFTDCTTCHTLWPHSQPSPLTKQSLAATCGTCHIDEYKQHVDSIHGQKLREGYKDVATCVDCHSKTQNPHDIQPILSHESTVYRKNVSATCAACHANPEVMRQYNVDPAVAQTYQETFHGKAMKLSSFEIEQCNKATCSDCHGTHDIVADTNPSSPVRPENLATTCGSCHPGAGANFAKGWMGHSKPSPSNFPVVYWSNIGYIVLIVGAIAFGAMHVMLDFFRTRQRHRELERDRSVY